MRFTRGQRDLARIYGCTPEALPRVIAELEADAAARSTFLARGRQQHAESIAGIKEVQAQNRDRKH